MPSRDCRKTARVQAPRQQTQGAAVQPAAQCAPCSTHALEPTTLTAAAAATSCRSAQRAGAIKLDRRPEKAGQERARQRRPEERCRHLFVHVTCPAEALHSRWAPLLTKLCGQSTLAALAPPCKQNLGAVSRSAVHEHDTTSAWPSPRSMEFDSSWSTTVEQGADSATA